MTNYEQEVHDEIREYLNNQGYHPYAVLLDDFDIVPFTWDEEKALGYMIPNQGEIHINVDLDIETVSTIIRHEILHQYLDHFGRMAAHLGVDVEDYTVDEIMNMAGDYEISNVGYTQRDKQLLRRIQIAGQELKALITSDDHPEWQNLDFEDIYDKLKELQPKVNQHVIHGTLKDPKTFIDTNGKKVRPVVSGGM